MPDATRPGAIRGLVEMVLAGREAGGKRNPKAAAKASRLAAEEIERVADNSAPSDVRAKRKRRLLKGPSEFRAIRKD